MNTIPEIKSAAKAHNADYPEAAAEIDAGEAVIRIGAHEADNFGKRVRLVVTPGVVAPDGGFIEAAEPEFVIVPRRDGRLTKTQVAQRYYRRLIAASVVPVRIVEGR